MNNKFFKKLINQPESETLDFKEEIYDFSVDNTKPKNKQKEEKERKQSKFIKDIISFSNTIRTKTSFIIIGVKETDNNNEIIGITTNSDDATFQEIIKDKVRPIPKFLYSEFQYEGKKFGIFEMKVEKFDLPCKPIKAFGVLEKNTTYIRRGTSNQEATFDEERKLQKWLNDLPNNINSKQNNFYELEQNYLKKLQQNSEYQKHNDIYIELYGKSEVFETEILGVHKNATSLLENFISSNNQITKEKKEIQSIFDFISENPKCIIIGGAGTGKTTTLNTLIHKYCNESINNQQKKIPIFIKSKEISSHNRFINIIEKAINKEWLKNSLENGHIIFLIDGLNEIPIEYQRESRIDIKNIIERYPKNSFVFSERKFGFENIFNLPIFEIKEFDESQIIQLITKYSNEHATSLIKQLKNKPQLFSLAKTPFLLTMIILVSKKNNYKIPENQGLLFQQFIETLLLWENEKRKYISILVKKDILSYTSYNFNSIGVKSVPIAKFKQFLNEALNRIKEKITTNEIYQELLINYFIQKSDNDELSFLHETYQEYFTALEMKSFFEKYNEFPVDIVESEWIESFSLCRDIVKSNRTEKSINAVIADSINSHINSLDDYNSLIPFIERFAINNEPIFRKTKNYLKKIPTDYLTDKIKNKLNIRIKTSKLSICRVISVKNRHDDIQLITATDTETNEILNFTNNLTYYKQKFRNNILFHYEYTENNELTIQPILKTVSIDLTTKQNTVIKFFRYYEIEISPLPETSISENNYILLYEKFNKWYKDQEQVKYKIRQYSIELVQNCISGNLSNIKELINKGADVNYSNVRGLTPLMLSVRKKHYTITKYLLSQTNLKLNQRSKDGRGMTAFMYACQNGNIQIINLFLEKGIDVNEGSNGLNIGNKALLIASWEGKINVVKLLLEKGSDINQIDSHGFTALIKASIRGKYQVAEYLLEKGADVTIRDNKGQTAFQHCENQELKKLIKTYLK